MSRYGREEETTKEPIGESASAPPVSAPPVSAPTAGEDSWGGCVSIPSQSCCPKQWYPVARAVSDRETDSMHPRT